MKILETVHGRGWQCEPEFQPFLSSKADISLGSRVYPLKFGGRSRKSGDTELRRTFWERGNEDMTVRKAFWVEATPLGDVRVAELMSGTIELKYKSKSFLLVTSASLTACVLEMTSASWKDDAATKNHVV
jgi:hypothetical protein